MNEQVRNFRFKLKDAYASWIERIINSQFDEHIWNGYLITFMFNHIPGPFDHKCSVMTNEIERVYHTLGNYVVHNWRSKSQREKLPRLYAFPDYPGQKLEPFNWKDINCNDGLHYHGITVIRIDTKLRMGLDTFIMHDEHKKHLIKYGGPLRRIHIEPIDRAPRIAVGYAIKAIEDRIPDPNRLLILPKALSELPDRKPALKSDRRHLAA
jgi:hypothetical protein